MLVLESLEPTSARYYEDQHDGNGTKQTELPIYGGGRVGVAYKDASQNIARYSYELTDHLGNVRAVIEEQNGGAYVSYYADYYPFGWTMPERNGGSSYRYAYQACLSCLCRQGQEKDPETGWEAFELRMYDGRVGRWMTTDPYSEFHSPYLAMGNNPISSIDPDGGKVFGIGVNNAGKVVYDDGKADGMIYYLGNYDGELITSQEMLLDKMFGSLDENTDNSKVVTEFTIWLRDYEWIGTQTDLRNFISSQYQDMNVSDYTPLVGTFEVTKGEGYKMQTSVSRGSFLPNGDYQVQLLPRGQWEFSLSSDYKNMWNNIHLFRSILVHEARHFQQAIRSPLVIIYPSRDAAIKAGYRQELDAYNFQRSHYTWNLVPDPYKSEVNNRTIPEYKRLIERD